MCTENKEVFNSSETIAIQIGAAFYNGGIRAGEHYARQTFINYQNSVIKEFEAKQEELSSKDTEIAELKATIKMLEEQAVELGKLAADVVDEQTLTLLAPTVCDADEDLFSNEDHEQHF